MAGRPCHKDQFEGDVGQELIDLDMPRHAMATDASGG